MARKTKPTGYIARCQCGAIVGAMDQARTPHYEAGKLLGSWLHEGFTIEPRWGDWSATMRPCRCDVPVKPPPGCDRGTMINQNIPDHLRVGWRADSSLPEGTYEVWQDGKLLGRIENIGRR